MLDQVPIVNFTGMKKTGPEYYLAVSLAPQELKQRMVKIEETHPYGRLVDLDVLWGNEEQKPSSRRFRLATTALFLFAKKCESLWTKSTSQS